MAWRETFIRRFGPGMLGGVTLGDWLQLLADNRFAVAPDSLVRAISITTQAAQNSIFRWTEDLRYDQAVRATKVLPPIFILGHWRSGTTLLHNLLAADGRFSFPNNYQALFPNSFLTLESIQLPFIQKFLSPRRPMDNVEWTMHSPQEDEFALCILTGLSPVTGWFFPRRRQHYDRYLTFVGVPVREVRRWKSALMTFLKRLTYKYRRPLVLKSPTHTARVRLLLEMFPGAKFVHVHRDPLAVFASTRHMLKINFEMHRLQRPPGDAELDEWILRQYRTMYDAFFAERALIPPGDYYELSFEALESDPLGETARLYEALSLPDFAAARPAVERHVRQIKGYRKNEFLPLPPDLRRRIAGDWRRCFEEWGYDSTS